MKKEFKQGLSLMLVFLMILTSLPLNVLAEDGGMTTMETDGVFTWTAVAGGVEITGYDGGGVAVEIPDMLDGKKVVGIGSNVFNGKAITSVKFTNNLLYLKDGVFNNCDALVEIELPTSLTAIRSVEENPTFGNCEKLKKVSIPKSVTDMDGYGMFKGSPLVEIDGEAPSAAKDYALEANPEITFNIIEFLVVDDLQVSPDSEISVGNPVTLTATASGGSGIIKYDFFWDLVSFDGTTSTDSITEDSALNTVSFNPTKAGTYTFYVRVEDDKGKMAQKSYGNFTVTNEPVIKENGFTASKASPQYYDSEILLSVETAANTGSGTLNYRFYYTNGEVIQELGDLETPQATFKPAEPGLYNLYVEVTDQQGRTAKSEILNYSIVDDLAVKSFTASPDNSQTHSIGTTIVLNAEGSGGKTAYQYRVYAVLKDGEEIPIQDFSAAATASFTPTKAGSYDLFLEVKNGSGKIVPETIKNYIITPVVTLTAEKAGGNPGYAEDEISLNANISGIKDDYSYSYGYSLDSSTTKIPIKTGVTDTAINFKLPSAGTYHFYVDIVEKSEVVASATAAAYSVLTRPAVTLTADKLSPQNRNTTVKFAASASGGKGPYTYLFACDREGSNIYQGELTTTSSLSLPLNEAGEYNVMVVARDANGITAEMTSLVYVIKDNPLAQLSTSRNDEITHYAGDAVTLTAAVDGGTAPFTYRFYYKLGSKTVELTDSLAKDLAAISFTPDRAGNYTFIAEATDKNGLKTTATKTGYKVLAAVSTKSFITNKPSGQNINTAIKLTANGSGGKTPYTYKFFYQLDENPIKNPIELDDKALPTTNTVLFEPTRVGEYTLNVEIKDDNGNGKTTTKTIANYKIVNGPVIEALSAVKKEVPEDSIYVNDPILVTAELQDGTGAELMQYRFTIKNGSRIVKAVTQEDENSFEFIPDTAGSYSVTVEVKDEDGLTATQTLKNVVVLKTVTAVLKADKASGTTINTGIKLTATATGGKAPYTYAFEWEDKQGNIKPIQEKSSLKTASLQFSEPEDVGFYTLRVTVTDANGVEAVGGEITEYQIKNPPVLDDFSTTPVKGAVVYPGKAITLKADVKKGTGEHALEYAFYVNGSTEKLVDNDSDPTDVIYTPRSGGTYSFEVVVSDGVTAVKKKITGYKVNAGLEVTSLNASKSDGLIIGETIKLTAAGKGGVSPYTYQFSYKIDDEKGAVIKAETPIPSVDNKLKTIDFPLDQAGNYTFYVEITDKNDEVSLNTVSKALALSVTDPPIITGLAVTDPETDKTLTNCYINNEIALTATNKAEAGGENLTYTFAYKVGSKSGTIEAANVKDNVASFEPTIAGTYTFYVSARDDDTGWTSATYVLGKFVVLKTFAVKSLKTSKPSGQDINTEIKLTATPDGGKAPYTYVFYQKIRENEDDQITTVNSSQLPGDTAKNFATFKPEKEGNYILMVEITDGNKTKASYSMDYEINNPPVVTLTTNKTGKPVYEGDSVKLTATVATDTGIGELDYRFYWKRGTATEDLDTDLTADKRLAEADFVPDLAGAYTLFVEVTDDNYVTKTAKIASFKVLGKVNVKSLVADKKTPQNIGTTIKLTATGAGGKTPYKYQFYYKLDSENDEDDVVEWKAIGSQSTSKYANYPLKKPGLYAFRVMITDANNITSSIEEDSSMLMDYQVMDPPVIRRFSVAPTGKQYEGDEVALTTAVSGGSGDYLYEFSYQLGKETPVAMTETADDTPEAIIFKPEKAGTYKLFVKVTDKKNADEASNFADKDISNYAVIKKASVKDFTISKTSIAKGGTVRLSAIGQDGVKPYYYQFSMKKDDDSKETIIKGFSSAYYYSYKPLEKGNYTFYVDIKDSKNAKVTRSEKTITLGVTD
ncbi:MAG: hypothetical protein CVU92_00885 [Firmicutes bacterium HGW-Firmicutes-17]|nr:MAG: hypothetical protein CVU92_00885 [Firmicutes bacterium HGW-Firmicutes-17]